MNRLLLISALLLLSIAFNVEMSQNIYDKENFFDNYATMNRSIIGLKGAPEWPTTEKMLPKLSGLNVVDLGCGYGWFSRYACENGATQVLAMDISQRMLDKATELTKECAITYKLQDLEVLQLSPNNYDLVYSSLTIHYIVNVSELFQTVYDSLKPGGYFFFSTEHPANTASETQDSDDMQQICWPISSYRKEGKRFANWFGERVVMQHRKMATYINLLLGKGFHMRQVEEWSPTDDELREKERTLFFGMYLLQKPI